MIPEEQARVFSIPALIGWLLWTERMLCFLLTAFAITVAAWLSALPWQVFAGLWVIPLGMLLLAILKLPADVLSVAPAQPGNSVLKLQAATLVSAGFSPFVVWWLNAPANAYLTVAASVATVSSAWLLMEINGFLRLFFHCFDCRRWEALAGFTREWCFYGALLPVLVINGLFVWGCLTMPNVGLPDFPNIWRSTPLWLAFALSVPIALTALLAWQARKTIAVRIRSLAEIPTA